MCYSAKASFISFSVAVFFSYKLFIRNKGHDRSVALIIFGISTIQIAEFLMHLNYDCKSKLNKFSSILGLLILLLVQPIFSILSNINTGKKLLSKELFIHILIWFIFVGYTYYKFWPKDNELCTEKLCQGDCKLNWKWFKSKNDIIYWILYVSVILIIPLYMMHNNTKGFNNKTILWITYIILSIIIITLYNDKYFATLWCFWGPLGAYLIQYYL